MKKFLSLVLSLAMAMSLVTVGAGAKEFKDDNKIAYDEAVAVISELGVVDGYESGNFNPEGGLTRGAAAKIICNMVLGPTTASALSADAKSFKDVPTNHPFAGYIAYCAQQGIINGYDSNTFKPEAPLTGNHFMKMLLGALGYDGEVEGFTGPNWTINVSKLAYGLKLDDGNKDAVLSKPITRQEAALYAFNTLQADMVEYDTKTTVSKGDLTVQIAGTNAKRILQTESGYADTLEPTVAAKERTLQFAEKYFDKLTKTNNNMDAFGRPATEWKYKANIIGQYNDYSDMVAEYKGEAAPQGELYNTIGSSIVDGLKQGTYAFNVYVNGEKVSAPVIANYMEKNSTKEAGLENTAKATGVSGNGVLTQVFMDDDSNVTISMINTFLVKATADFNSTKNEVTVERVDVNTDSGVALPALSGKLDGDDFDVAGVKEDDYLLVTYSIGGSGNAGNDDIEEVIPAKMLTGKVTQYTDTDNVVMDGTKYEYNAIVGDAESRQEFTINENASLVLDQYGHIIYVDEAISTNSFVYIAQFGSSNGMKADAMANAYFTDGTNSVIKVKKVDGEDTKKDIADYGYLQNHTNWYTYIKNSNDEYTLTSVTGNRVHKDLVNSAGPITGPKDIVMTDRVAFLKNGLSANTLEDTTVKANDKTIFVTLDPKEKVTVGVGMANIPEVVVPAGGSLDNFVAGSKGIQIDWIADKDGYAQYVFIDASHAGDGNVSIKGTAMNDYVMLLQKVVDGEFTNIDGNKYVEYKVLIDGKEETRMIEKDLVVDAQIGSVFSDVRVNSDGYIDEMNAVTNDSGSAIAFRADEDIVLDLQHADAQNKITQSGNTMTVKHEAVAGETTTNVYTNKDTKINLLIGENCKYLKDQGLKYQLYQNTTLGTITGLLANDVDVRGAVTVVLDKNTADLAKEIYVYISAPAFVPDGSTGGGGSTVTAVTVVNGGVSFGATTRFDYYKADGTPITDDEVQKTLEAAGAKNVTRKVDKDGLVWNFTKDNTPYEGVEVTPTQTFKVTVDNATKYLDGAKTIGAGGDIVAKSADGKWAKVEIAGSAAAYPNISTPQSVKDLGGKDMKVTTGLNKVTGLTAAQTEAGTTISYAQGSTNLVAATAPVVFVEKDATVVITVDVASLTGKNFVKGPANSVAAVVEQGTGATDAAENGGDTTKIDLQTGSTYTGAKYTFTLTVTAQNDIALTGTDINFG